MADDTDDDDNNTEEQIRKEAIWKLLTYKDMVSKKEEEYGEYVHTVQQATGASDRVIDYAISLKGNNPYAQKTKQNSYTILNAAGSNGLLRIVHRCRYTEIMPTAIYENVGNLHAKFIPASQR